LQACAVEHGDIPPVIVNQRVRLQRARRLGDAHAAPPNNSARSSGVTWKWSLLPILGHQQPAGEARLHHVEAGAGEQLRTLVHQPARSVRGQTWCAQSRPSLCCVQCAVAKAEGSFPENALLCMLTNRRLPWRELEWFLRHRRDDGC